MAARDDLLPKAGDLIASKYQVEGVLGTGGMGAVFEVSHRVTGKRFAVKWLLPSLAGEAEAVKRFIREAQVAGRVDHPNIVEVYDVGQEGSSSFMVMELLHGEPLSERISRAGKLDATEACELLIPVTRGLSAAHAAGIVHRDLKPDNIYLCRSETGKPVPKILDFGISKMSNVAGEVTAGITRAGVVMGTPHYMAPEQVRAKPVDARTDVYAMGVILYEMLSGEKPFPGDTYSDLVLRIMTETPIALTKHAPGMPVGLVRVCERAMARDPEARFASAAELGRALESFASGIRFEIGSVVQARDPGGTSSTHDQVRTPTPLSTSSERIRTGDFLKASLPRGLVYGVAGVVALVLALGFGLYTMRGPDAEDEDETAETASNAVTPSPRDALEAQRERAAASAGPAQPGTSRQTDTTNTDELPVPNTVRIGPDPEVEVQAQRPPTADVRPDAGPSAIDERADEARSTVAHHTNDTNEASAPGTSRREKGRASRAARPTRANGSANAAASGGAQGAERPASNQPASGGHRSLGLSLDDF